MKRTPAITLALTGNFGCGKSKALDCFRRLGAETVDCDKIAHELTDQRNSRLIQLLVKKFGPRILAAKGKLNRRALAREVFSSPAQRKKLERILHPLILKRVWERLALSRKPVRVVEVPLLFESKLEGWFDAAVAVRCSPRAAMKRLARLGWSSSEVRARWRTQMPLEKKCQKADFILDNNGSSKKLYKQAAALYQACLSVTQNPNKK